MPKFVEQPGAVGPYLWNNLNIVCEVVEFLDRSSFLDGCGKKIGPTDVVTVIVVMAATMAVV